LRFTFVVADAAGVAKAFMPQASGFWSCGGKP